MNKKIKRVVSSVLVVSVVFLLLFGEAAYVQATEVNEEAYTIEDEIGDVVEEFYDDLEWKISNITPIFIIILGKLYNMLLTYQQMI